MGSAYNAMLMVYTFYSDDFDLQETINKVSEIMVDDFFSADSLRQDIAKFSFNGRDGWNFIDVKVDMKLDVYGDSKIIIPLSKTVKIKHTLTMTDLKNRRFMENIKKYYDTYKK